MKFVKRTLKNGLRVVTVPMRDNPTVTVMVLVGTGSKYESKRENGLAHFLEHMCFKGTARRPRAADISGELDGLGASYNAFTSREYTGYYAKAEARHFEKILDVVSDLYLNPALKAEEIEKEKGVIVGEIKMHRDEPRDRAWEIFYRLLYGETPAGRPVAGTPPTVKKFSRADFRHYRARHYLAGKTVVVVAGGAGGAKIFRTVKRVFENVPRGRTVGKPRVRERQKKPALSVLSKKTDQTHFILGVRAFDMYDKDEEALDLLALILGGNSSSRLFQKVREEMGAGYYVGAGGATYTDHGFLYVAAGVHNDRVVPVIRVIMEEFSRLIREPVSSDELKRAKDFVEGKMAINLEPSDAYANYYGFQALLKKKILTSREEMEKIRRVTVGDIRRAAKRIFKNSRLNLALVGPLNHKSALQKILKITQ